MGLGTRMFGGVRTKSIKTDIELELRAGSCTDVPPFFLQCQPLAPPLPSGTHPTALQSHPLSS